MIVLQLLLYCLLFTGMVKIFVIGGAVNGLYFYPKEVQECAIAFLFPKDVPECHSRKPVSVLYGQNPKATNLPIKMNLRRNYLLLRRFLFYPMVIVFCPS